MSEVLNKYKCYKCGHIWHDVWECGCDDDCPECGARHCSPLESYDLDGEENRYKTHFNEVIKPKLIEMAIDGTLPSDLNELHYEHFTD